MRICILSMQDVPNFGSLLQSYSLKKLLERLGHKVFFLAIEPNEEDNRLLQGKSEDYSVESGEHGILAKLRRIDKYAINRLHIKKKAALQECLFNEFRQEVLKINYDGQNEKYDHCVIGSDEVFNCNVTSAWGFTSQLFGNVRQAQNVITYAACCGSTKVESVPESVKERIGEAFQRISAFSVRDENTKIFVENIAGIVPEIHLDPVIVGNFDEEIKQSDLPAELPAHYCIVYSYYNRINNEQDIFEIKKFCKLHNLEIVSVGAPQMWIKNHIVCTPFEMLKMFGKADFVITDTFHGTIFSAKYSSKFAVITRESNTNKLYDLIKRLNLDNHLINTMSELEKAYGNKKKQMEIDAISCNELNRTLDYLKASCRMK